MNIFLLIYFLNYLLIFLYCRKHSQEIAPPSTTVSKVAEMLRSSNVLKYIYLWPHVN